MGSAPHHNGQEAQEMRRPVHFFAHYAGIVKTPFNSKRVRMFILRRLVRHYSRCTSHPFDRVASARLDAILYLVESEEAGEVNA